MSAHPTSLPDTTPLRRLVRQTRRLLRSSWVVTGLGLTVGLLLGTLVATTLVDLVLPLDALLPAWLAPTPWPGLRLAALLLVVVPAAWALFAGVVRPLFRRLTPVGVARRIESHLPGIHNRLVSALDLSAQPAQTSSQAFYRRLLNEALERVRGFRPSTVLDLLSLRRAGLFALASTGAFVLALVVFSDRMPTALARILRPFADIPPASSVQYTVQASSMGAPVAVGADGLGHVLRGEDVVFDVEVTSEKKPDGLYVELTGPDGKSTLRRDLEKVDDAHWRAVLAGKLPAGLEDQFHYRVFGGRTWTTKHRVAMIDRPTLVGLHTVLHYPQYMALPPEERRDPAQTAEVVGPEGTADDPAYVEVVAQADGDVAHGEVQILKQVASAAPVKDSLENAWLDKELPHGARADGTWHWKPEGMQGRPNAHTEPPAVGLHGHWFSEAAELKVQPGERLFTYVYVVPGHEPETILLEWNDGTSWEHRAYWGAASKMLNAVGKPDSPSRHTAGPLPPTGRWVRLEVPAASIGLEGKAVRGMAFKLVGGQCLWSKAGTLPEQKEWAVAQRFEMQPAGDKLWSGRFPLRGTGHYRVELRNQLGYPNQAMKECKFTAVPDAPPYVMLERPGPDLVLSKPGKVGLSIRAQDDYGLKEIALYLRRGDKGEWAREVVHSFDRPQRDSGEVTAALDLAARKLVLGDTLFYRVEAVDRRGQTAIVPAEGAYKIRLAADANAADQRLAAFEKTQDPFQEKLANLIAAQAKIKEAFDKLNQKYAPLMEKVQTAKAEAKQRLDPASAKLLDAMKAKLTELAREQEKARQMGKEPSKPPAGAPPKLDAESAKLLEETRQKLVELANERAKTAQPQAPPPAEPQLDAESRRLLAEARDKLSELTWQKEQNARAGQPPKQPAAAPMDAESQKVLKDLQNKLAQLDAEREKNALAGKGMPPDKPVQLDPESAKKLAEMQKALAELAGQEQAVHQQADQLSKDLARSADEAGKLDMLPPQIAELMKHAQEAFERQGVSTLRDLVESMQRAAAARKEAPPDGKDLKHIEKGSAIAKEELEALKKRLEALAEARKKLGNDPGAMADLDRKMMEADGEQAARDLKELLDRLSKLKDELAKQKDAQDDLKGEADKAADKDLPVEAGKQDQMDRDVGDVLGKTKDLQASDRVKRMKKKMRPDAPYTPEADESPDRPREEDSEEPLPSKKGAKDDAGKGDAKKGDKKDDDEDDDEKKFLPQLGGRKDKIDPRYARKRRPGDRKPGEDPRGELEDRQTQNLRDLDSAEKSVESDRRSLENMLNRLGQARQGRQGRPTGQEPDPLGQMMNSPQMRAAQSMLSRARQGRSQGQPGQQTQRGGLQPNLRGGPQSGRFPQIDLDKLDAPTRAALLRMQPEAREKLLQSLRDAGPEGYERHIMEYYKRLSETKDK
jgi:hypothetical protein